MKSKIFRAFGGKNKDKKDESVNETPKNSSMISNHNEYSPHHENCSSTMSNTMSPTLHENTHTESNRPEYAKQLKLNPNNPYTGYNIDKALDIDSAEPIIHLNEEDFILNPENLKFARKHNVKLLPNLSNEELIEFENVLEISRTCIDKIFKVLDEEKDWVYLGTSKCVHMRRKVEDEKLPYIYHGTIELGTDIDVIDAMIFFWEADPLKYNPNVDRSFRITDYSTSFPNGCHLSTFYQSFKGAFGIPGRDALVTCFITSIDENTTIFASTSCGLDQTKYIVGQEQKRIRATLYKAAIICKRDPLTNITTLQFIWQGELAGSLPNWVQKLISTGTLSNLVQMKSVVLGWLNDKPLDPRMDLKHVCRNRKIHIDQWGGPTRISTRENLEKKRKEREERRKNNCNNNNLNNNNNNSLGISGMKMNYISKNVKDCMNSMNDKFINNKDMRECNTQYNINCIPCENNNMNNASINQMNTMQNQMSINTMQNINCLNPIYTNNIMMMDMMKTVLTNMTNNNNDKKKNDKKDKKNKDNKDENIEMLMMMMNNLNQNMQTMQTMSCINCMNCINHSPMNNHLNNMNQMNCNQSPMNNMHYLNPNASPMNNTNQNFNPNYNQMNKINLSTLCSSPNMNHNTINMNNVSPNNSNVSEKITIDTSTCCGLFPISTGSNETRKSNNVNTMQVTTTDSSDSSDNDEEEMKRRINKNEKRVTFKLDKKDKIKSNTKTSKKQPACSHNSMTGPEHRI